MTDPLMPAFCCKRPENWIKFYNLILDIDSQPYNSICMISSAFGMLGALYQVFPKITTRNLHHWYWTPVQRNRKIIFWLAFSDLFASLGIFVRSFLKMVSPSTIQMFQSDMLICYLISFWIQYFYVVSWLWTLIYAVDVWLALREKNPLTKTYHCIAWILPAVFTLIGLYILYFPEEECFPSIDASFWKFFPNYLVSYIPLLAVMIINPILYCSSWKSAEMVVSQYLSQYTNKERLIVDMIKIKFGLINLVFYTCWSPNVINAFLIFFSWNHFPRTAIVFLWYIMAILNPLQALFNSLVYQRSSDKTRQFWGSSRQFRYQYVESSERNPLLLKKSGSSNDTEADFVL